VRRAARGERCVANAAVGWRRRTNAYRSRWSEYVKQRFVQTDGRKRSLLVRSATSALRGERGATIVNNWAWNPQEGEASRARSG
jgi:hypothetical protein